MGKPTFLPLLSPGVSEPPACSCECLAGHLLKHLGPLGDPERFGQAVAKHLTGKWMARELGDPFGPLLCVLWSNVTIKRGAQWDQVDSPACGICIAFVLKY